MAEIIGDPFDGEFSLRRLSWPHRKRITFWETLTVKIPTEEDLISRIDPPPPFKFAYHRCRSRYDTRAGIMRVCWMYLS